MIRLRKRMAFWLAITTALTMLTALPGAAHPEGPAHHAPLPEHATTVMRAFFADRLAPQLLSSLSSTACSGGFAAGYPCSNVDLESFVSLADLGGSPTEEANDIWGWTDPQTGKEYALIGMTFGTAFVDITAPSAPIYVGELRTHGAFGSLWRDIKTFNNHAFIVSEARGHGIQVFDLTQLRNVNNPPVTFSETAHYNKMGAAHNIVINEGTGYAYAVGVSGKNSCNGGLHMVNIVNPTSPSFAGCFSTDGYTHDAQCVIYNGPDAEHQGKEICIASNEDTVTVVDVTNKSNPVQLSRTGYSGSAYTHQGWLTEDQTQFLLDDELDEQNFGHGTRTRVWDMSNLDAPTLTGTYTSASSSIDHNQYVKGDLSYQANYRSGLRILDASDAANGNLSQVGYFDVYPADDVADFNGAWSNYPYFDSGVVIVSGIEQGLFVLRPGLGPVDNPPTVSVTNPADGATVVGTINVTADSSDDNGVTQVEFFVDGDSIGIDATAPYSVSWDTTSTSDGTHTVSATASDTAAKTATDSASVTVDNIANPMIHVGDLDGASVSAGRGGRWDASVTVSVHDSAEAAIANATVTGTWSTGGSGLCVTNGSGQCSITDSGIRRNVSSTTFTVSSVTASGSAYVAGASHDPDGDSNGVAITITSP